MLIVLNNPAFACGFFAITEKFLHLSERLVVVLLLGGLKHYFISSPFSVENIQGIVELVVTLVGQVFLGLGVLANGFINLRVLDFLIFYYRHHHFGASRIDFS